MDAINTKSRWSSLAELIGTLAIVVSLIYVGLQVRQNTAAIRASTSAAVYQLHQDLNLPFLENAELAELVLRASEQHGSLTTTDSLRYATLANLRFNLLESVYTHARRGTMEADLAAGWLATIAGIRCDRMMARYWESYKLEYHARFRTTVDSAFATSQCD